jgi:hypothetical protein
MKFGVVWRTGRGDFQDLKVRGTAAGHGYSTRAVVTMADEHRINQSAAAVVDRRDGN